MEFARLQTHLASDYARLREAAEGNLGAPVPTCPEWTVADLVHHVATVYLHKAESIRTGKEPKPWPPDPGQEPPLDRLDRAYAGLIGEFAARDPGSAAPTWYDPDQTVGFWIRRMAQETVIHRVDAELARGPAGPIPADLALDGISEVLECFLRYGSQGWPEEFASLPDQATPPVLVTAGDDAWLVRATKEGVTVEPAAAAGDAPVGDTAADAAAAGDVVARVSGDPASVLLWLWRRVGDDRVTVSGDRDLVAGLWRLLYDATQ
jgi:uncharacterized protein (TIGR03083 family)